MLHRAERYAPHLSNSSGAAGGRTFPSAAGFHSGTIFFTDDDGEYVPEVWDAFCRPGAYLETHTRYLKEWHGGSPG